VPPSQAVDVRLSLSFLWTRTINHKASHAPPLLQLIVISYTRKSNTIPYFESKCKINKAVIISGVSKLGHNSVTTENWKQRGEVSDTGNVTMKLVRATIVAMEKQCVLCVCVCVCSLRYRACNALAPCFRLWPARLYNIFPRFFVNGTI